MVVPVLMTSCQISEKPKIGPVAAQTDRPVASAMNEGLRAARRRPAMPPAMAVKMLIHGACAPRSHRAGVRAAPQTVKSATVAPERRGERAGAAAKTWCGVPAAAQITSKSRIRGSSQVSIGAGARAARRRRWRSRYGPGRWPRPPSPAAPPASAAALPGSTRLPPAVRNSTCRSDPATRKTIDLTIWSTRAAAGARRVLGGAGALGEPHRRDVEPAPAPRRRATRATRARSRAPPQRSSTST